MKTPSRALAPALALAAIVAATEPPPAARQEPQATGTAEHAPKSDLRPAQDAGPERRPAVRVILPSPYSQPR